MNIANIVMIVVIIFIIKLNEVLFMIKFIFDFRKYIYKFCPFSKYLFDFDYRVKMYIIKI